MQVWVQTEKYPQMMDTRGHGTTGMAKFYKKELAELLKNTAALTDIAALHKAADPLLGDRGV